MNTRITPCNRTWVRSFSLGLLMPVLLGTAFSASAISLGLQAGEHYTDVRVDMGKETPGFYSQLTWAHNDNDGDRGGAELGFGLPLGSFLISAGGKLLYLHPRGEDDGYAIAVGSRLAWNITQKFTIFGEGYYSPDSLSSEVDHYREMDAGLRWAIVRPVTLSVGYRYIDLAGKDGRRSRKIADGMYLGGEVGF